MPHYYFRVIDDLDTSDDEGAELHDEQAARQRAVGAARVLMCETMKRDGRITLSHRIEIQNEVHRTITSVTFGEAIDIVP